MCVAPAPGAQWGAGHSDLPETRPDGGGRGPPPPLRDGRATERVLLIRGLRTVPEGLVSMLARCETISEMLRPHML